MTQEGWGMKEGKGGEEKVSSEGKGMDLRNRAILSMCTKEHAWHAHWQSSYMAQSFPQRNKKLFVPIIK